MNWSDVLADASLRDLPYKIETNAFGQIVMSPASPRHSRQQSLIERVLLKHVTDGEVFVECAIQTPVGVKVADVVWASESFFLNQDDDQDAYSSAPEICIEVLSRSNSQAEIDDMRALYFRCGAEEVWVCDQQGHLEFYAPSGMVEASQLAPHFPAHVPLKSRTK